MERVYSFLMKCLRSGVFTITGEVEPLKTTDISELVHAVYQLRGYVAAVNITDNPQAFAYMSGLAASHIIQEQTGVEVIFQLTCRDRNRLALVSDVLGAAALGIRNVLALTGDHPTLGDNPDAKPVYDLDSVHLVRLIRKMVDEGVDLAGNKIAKPPRLHVGVAANPGADPLEPELLKLVKKVKAGAEFVQTQVVYDIEIAKNFLKEAESLGINIPILIGICPLKSYAMAKWMDKYCPGIKIPRELMEKIKRAKETGGKKAIEDVNVEVFGEFIRELKKTTHAAGCHVMAVGFEWIVPRIVEEAGIGRIYGWRERLEREVYELITV